MHLNVLAVSRANPFLKWPGANDTLVAAHHFVAYGWRGQSSTSLLPPLDFLPADFTSSNQSIDACLS
jgi:hypothetical protein